MGDPANREWHEDQCFGDKVLDKKPMQLPEGEVSRLLDEERAATEREIVEYVLAATNRGEDLGIVLSRVELGEYRKK